MAYTSTLAVKLAKMTSAQIVWITCIRYKKGWKFSAELWDQSFSKEIDENKILINLNKKMESLIYENPEEYLWGYDRFKKPKNN